MLFKITISYLTKYFLDNSVIIDEKYFYVDNSQHWLAPTTLICPYVNKIMYLV